MKITRTAEQVARAKKAYEVAHEGCYKCPCCGETNSDKPNSKGIYEMMPTMRYKGFFPVKLFQIDKYRCRVCGAQWESEPYEVAL